MSTAAVQGVIQAQTGPVFEITLARPERKNAIDLAMYRQLTRLLAEVADNASVRAVVVQGDREAFTAGNDLADFRDGADLDPETSPIARFMHTLLVFPKPLIAAVAGPAVGIGTTLLLHCDLIYAAPNAQLQMPFVNLGLCPEFAASLLLPRIVGRAKASEWLLTGRMISAEEALCSGLINDVVDDPWRRAREQAELIARQPPRAVRTCKALLREPQQAPVEAAVHREAQAFTQALRGGEFREAVSAFFEKRAADFSGFR